MLLTVSSVSSSSSQCVTPSLVVCFNHGRSCICAFTGLDGILLHLECELLHKLLILYATVITSLRSNNKDCTEAEYLYSSSVGASAEALSCEFFELLQRYWSSQGAPSISLILPSITDLNSSFTIRPSA